MSAEPFDVLLLTDMHLNYHNLTITEESRGIVISLPSSLRAETKQERTTTCLVVFDLPRALCNRKRLTKERLDMHEKMSPIHSYTKKSVSELQAQAAGLKLSGMAAVGVGSVRGQLLVHFGCGNWPWPAYL